MIIFRRIEDKLYLAKDQYEPTYIIEMCRIGPDVMKLVELEKFDSLFIIMMMECPTEVRVEYELAENAFDDLQQRRSEIVLKIQDMLDHKWIESEKAQRDLGGAALVDWILKFDKT
ncbi:MAG: hypothetical protein D8M57_04245 [Candidatus Scalindua sp. AMX11]|nr:MAG: hypothetical protein DWQ00_02190 [Candidatus Scalindua sp.]NOG84670.1 hypothetical protein [Planctomycetota bacterium]RZV92441.1 MAG: hypothetical protein EX341_05185 [Candidatus Scalindua sp. SCAELEC01]TDE66030.1 MAG: hypothetical protein D8M57_04245 [Candidatus Scalindua sp. AMX11]GJQ59001.1 MAG: hypothetical protein SCALA701_18020 [Candidatus Scalindua sp.]